VGRRSNDLPLRVTRIRQLPCEDVDAVFSAVIKRVLNAQNAVPIRTETQADEHDQAGEDDG
jgi:hypothetical protein